MMAARAALLNRMFAGVGVWGRGRGTTTRGRRQAEGGWEWREMQRSPRL